MSGDAKADTGENSERAKNIRQHWFSNMPSEKRDEQVLKPAFDRLSHDEKIQAKKAYQSDNE